MMRSEGLSARALIEALERGDFYASTGVTLSTLTVTPQRIALTIDAAPGVSYETRFLGSLRSQRDDGERALVLRTAHGATASDEPTGEELFVRAVVVSSRLQHNAPVEGERERSWIQPVIPAAPTR